MLISKWRCQRLLLGVFLQLLDLHADLKAKCTVIVVCDATKPPMAQVIGWRRFLPSSEVCLLLTAAVVLELVIFNCISGFLWSRRPLDCNDGDIGNHS